MYQKFALPPRPSLQKHPFLLALRRSGRFARRNARNVPSGEKRVGKKKRLKFRLTDIKQLQTTAALTLPRQLLTANVVLIQIQSNEALSSSYGRKAVNE